MIEMPEARLLSTQIAERQNGRRITGVTTQKSPHKFAFFHGEADEYGSLLLDKMVTGGCGVGGHAEIHLGEDWRLTLADGVRVRYHAPGEAFPEKHQLLITFDDDSALSMSVQMYGFFCLFDKNDYDNGYYIVAQKKPSPLTEAFDETYFDHIVRQGVMAKKNLSAKALLATEQRIPGLGNGVLQDILFGAGIHPKRKAAELSDAEIDKLFHSIKTTLTEMTILGGRDTETDIYGCAGGYATKLSSKKLGKPCPVCGEPIVREAYLGGKVYFCPSCQPL